jgi:methylenetetrahydrofolate dehydrogenase (NADP+)/methenyltetrahydrofolate cyclohydrolase
MSDAQIIDGKATAAAIRQELAADCKQLAGDGITPGLAVVLVGDNPASQTYVRGKEKAAAEVGITTFDHRLPATTSQSDLLALVDKLNNDPRVHGILVQLPLPAQIDESAVLLAIAPEKDADGFHPENMGRLLLGLPAPKPCTPYGCVELLMRHGHDPGGKHVVIVGRSNIVGKPLAAMLVQKAEGGNATVTVCHSRTANLPAVTQRADILVAAIGVPQFVKASMVREGAVIIDVGINRVDDETAKRGYRLVGDVAYDEVLPRVKAITPVPGGVGPMTIAMLLRNTLEAARAASTAARRAG